MKQRITKREFYASGGFSNPDLYRVQRSGRWVYYRVLDNR